MAILWVNFLQHPFRSNNVRNWTCYNFSKKHVKSLEFCCKWWDESTCMENEMCWGCWMMESLNYSPKLRYLRFGKMLKEMKREWWNVQQELGHIKSYIYIRWDLLVLYKVEYLLGCSVISYWTHVLLDAYLSLYRSYGKT
jgi:hypothetical protein